MGLTAVLLHTPTASVRSAPPALISARRPAAAHGPSPSAAYVGASPQAVRSANPSRIAIQRCGGHSCSYSDLERHAHATTGQPGARVTAATINGLRGSGKPLEANLRWHLEPAIGIPLAGVRIHADANAERLACQLRAKAFTTGHDIFFARGAFQPETAAGRHLLAHEAAHVAQQAAGPVPGTQRGDLSVSDPADRFEQEAEQVADRVSAGNAAGNAGVSSRAAAPDLGWTTPDPQTVAGRIQVKAGPITLQRVACEYEAGERTKATDRGILATDVKLLGGMGSGYDASPDSVVVTDFRPESAVVRTSATEELHRTWIGVLERQSRPYELLGFTDCVGEEGNNQKLRADRAHSVAAVLPNTARRASFIGAAPAGDFLLPRNSTPSERASNRAVLIRLPFEELRQAGEVDEYSAAAVRFWRSNRSSSVADLINFVSEQAAALLDRNLVPRPDVLTGKTSMASTLADFAPADWAITFDLTKMASASSSKVSPATKMADLTASDVAELAATGYHEFRHAEQSFVAARQTAAEAKGAMSPNDLARELDIPVRVAEEAVSASSVELPDKYKAEARSWRTTMPGGRFFTYKLWNNELRRVLEVIIGGLDFNKYKTMKPDVLKALWESALRKFFIDSLRGLSIRADKLLQDLQALPDQGPLDKTIHDALTTTSSKLFNTLATNQQGKNLPDTDAFMKMSPEDQTVAEAEAQLWVLTLQLHLAETQVAADDGYRAYPEEAEAYQVGDLVKESIKRKGP